MSARWRKLAEEWGKRLEGEARHRKYRRVYETHGDELGLTLAEIREFLTWLRADTAPDPAVDQVERTFDENAGSGCVVVKGRGVVKTEDDLIAQAEIDLGKWRPVRVKHNAWTTAMKDAAGKPQLVQNWQVDVRLERRFDAEVAVPSMGDPMVRQPAPARGRLTRALIIPDSQHGFRRLPGGYLEPMHDRAACDLAVQMAALLQPEEIVFLGDHLDLAEWSSKFPRPVELVDTTQPALRELHWWIRQIRTVAPSARIRYLEGNHEARICKLLVERTPAAASLTPVGEAEPAMSVSRLLALEDLDVEYVGPYGAESWLWDRVRVSHGTTHRHGGGATSAAVVKTATHSEVFGHVHKVEYAQRTVTSPRGPRLVTAMSPGSLCRGDGIVPGARNGAHEDWQHGLGVATLDVEADQVHMQVVPIIGGRLCWADQVLVGEDREAEIAAAVGWPALARPAA